MKKFDINPLFLVLASIFIFFISLYSLNNSKINQDKSLENFNKNIKIIKEYNSLKNIWTNAKKQEKLINKIIKQQHIKNANIQTNQNKIKVTIISNTKVLNRFVNKILNEKLNIVKLKLSKDKLVFEVGLL